MANHSDPESCVAHREVWIEVDQCFVDKTLHVKLETAVPVPGLSVFVTLPYKNATVRVSSNTHKTAVKIKSIDSFRAAPVFDTVQPGKTLLRVTFH